MALMRTLRPFICSLTLISELKQIWDHLFHTFQEFLGVK